MFSNPSNLTKTLYEFIAKLATSDKLDPTDYFLKCQYMDKMEIYFKNLISDHYDYFQLY